MSLSGQEKPQKTHTDSKLTKQLLKTMAFFPASDCMSLWFPFLFVKCQGSFLSLCSPFKLCFSLHNLLLTLVRLVLLGYLLQYILQMVCALEIRPADQLSVSAVGNLFALIA